MRQALKWSHDIKSALESQSLYFGQTAHNQAFKNFSSVHFTENQSILELV